MQGDFHCGVMHGQGRYTWKDGVVYEVGVGSGCVVGAGSGCGEWVWGCGWWECGMNVIQ